MNFKEIESKWQNYWQENEIFKTKNSWDKPKFYVLDMFPYPSWQGLHVGHPKGYIATDVIARKKVLEGYNVLHPMWWDAFGLPAENYAIKNKVHPKIAVEENVARFKGQLENIGFTYDWDREINTTDPKYYKWTQWIFKKLYTYYYDEKKDKACPIEDLEIPAWLSEEEKTNFIDSNRLAFVDYKPIIFCPGCMTGLANEDLEDGKCERCSSEVERRPMKQWVLRITKYAERLLNWLQDLPLWEDSIREMQKNWIGKSTWCEFEMKKKWEDGKSISVYTTRIDTVYSMAFAVIAPDHPTVRDFILDKNKNECEQYIKESLKKSDLDRTELVKEKSGVFSGSYVINPFNNEEVPLWISDFVLWHYWTWAIFWDIHDERDFEFAKKYGIPMEVTILPKNADEERKQAILNQEECFTEYWVLINSSQFDGLTSEEGLVKIAEYAEEKWYGKKKVNFKIQDWVFSRQRYWWEPIPMIISEDGKVTALEEKDLPLELPEVENYEPTGTEEWPLANISEWVEVENWKRETNTMPQWAGSSWYWLRYMDPDNDEALVGKEIEKYWGQVDVYVGWAEHATRHLIYARFWHKFLYDIDVVSTREPFKKLQHVWLIQWEDWRKMSKRWGNVINPDKIVDEFGADTLRVYEMFMGPFGQSVDWSANGVKWARRFLDKVIALSEKIEDWYSESKESTVELNKTIKKVTDNIDNFGFNTAISQMMICVNLWTIQEKVSLEAFEKFLLVLSPFASHLSEELWEKLGHRNSIFQEQWPEYDASSLELDTVTVVVQVNGKIRSELIIERWMWKDEVISMAKVDSKITKWLDGVEVVKEIYVPNKLVNFVVK